MVIITDDLRDMRISIIFSFALILFILACLLLPSRALPASFGQSHEIHWWDDRGPKFWTTFPNPPMGCTNCHYDDTPHHGNPYQFADMQDLADTTVCDGCHSQGGAYDGVAMAKANWDSGIYTGDSLEDFQTGKEQWCATCHDDAPANSKADGTGIDAPNIAGDDTTFGFYINGHKSSLCSDCHDLTTKHIDGEHRTYSFDVSQYNPLLSGVNYAAGYRLRYISGEVPLMIPANYGSTFGSDALNMINNAFRLCFDCHDSTKIFDDTPGDGIITNFKTSLPDPPCSYSLACGTINDHVTHMIWFTGVTTDSDWDAATVAGGFNGCDSMTACFSCHNVHGASGTEGSTNEPMIRDGSLAGRAGYGFSYVIEDASAGGYPMVTSTGATRSNSVGANFRNNTANNNMCFGCHGNPPPPAASSYNAETGPYLEYYRVPEVSLEFLAECPVDIQVIDPLERIVDKFQNEIQGAEYIELDFNSDGSLDNKIIVPRVHGNYTVSVFPEPGADPEDTYTLKAIDGNNTIILIKDEPVGNISNEQTFEVMVTNSGFNFMKLLGPNNGESSSVPVTFDWKSVGYNAFKLQFSSDKYFKQKRVTLPRRIPRRKWNWISDTTYTPTDKECRAIEKIGRRSGVVYWRVLGIDSEGNIGSSEIRSLFLPRTWPRR
jgi:hypothetical protein